MRIIKYLGLGILALVVLLAAGLSARSIYDRQIDYDVDLAGTEIPTFTEIELPQSHGHSDETSLPFTGGAVHRWRRRG